jgi:DNA repair protein SbcC/Rad50
VRPLRLEVEGFTAFRRPVVVDFEAAELFALVGPTGAGKTSVIDAITFALYGTVPRLDDRRAVAPVVSQNLTEARVRLDFGVGSERYTAVRVVRATKTGASTKEARLQRGDEVVAGTADEVSAAVTELLGLSYEHFTTCVSLPQGQFARFLHDKPRDRQDLLIRLLDLGLYDRVASAARQRAALAAGRTDVLNGQLEQLAGATPAALDHARAQVEQLAGLGSRIARVRPEVDILSQGAREAHEEASRCEQQVEALQRLHRPDGVAELCDELAAVAAARADCLAAEERAAAELADAEARLATSPPRAHLEQQRDDLRKRDELLRMAAEGRDAAADADDLVESAGRAEAAAEALHQQRSEALERLRVEQRAHALVPELRLGEPCPVCRHPVESLPDLHVPDLVAAQQALADATRQLKEASRSLTGARTEQARVEEKLARVDIELAEVTARLGDGVDLSDVDARLHDLAAAETAVQQAREADRSARQAIRDIDRRHGALTTRETEARRALDSARDGLAALEPPAIERRDLAADWAALIDWADQRRPVLLDELDRLRREATKLQEQADGRLAEVVEACRDAGVAVRPGEWPGEAVAAARARAEEAAERLDRELVEAERLRDEVLATTRERQVADTLATHLAANRFEKWLLDEAVHRLVDRASTILGDLSGDGYALSVDERSGVFTVIDHANASQPRPARTLSGGETFLASLALALALADQVAELATGGVARLEALFLDEGFGTLDADALDVVATALDELGARGRMVGVVTHVRELADRLPVRFEVRKVAGSASVERVDSDG